MCLITLSYKQHPDFPLILVQNRDELYDRESLPLHFWKDYPHVLSGRDKRHGGTWSGITKSGRVASLTNRPFDDSPAVADSFSRGKIVKDFLTDHDSIEAFLKYLRENRLSYDSYQLLFGTIDDLHIYSNATDQHLKLKPGLYSLSSTDDNLSQHKMQRSLKLVGQYLTDHPEPELTDLITLFKDKQKAEDIPALPSTVPYEMGRRHSSIFIEGDRFGTVNTTAVSVHNDCSVKVKEVRYDRLGELETSEEQFKLNS
ncbi:MAG: NRDE family protein [Alkalibacterium sp.]|nr:NRDE family protein [Alkalibacterium sp.]